MTDAAFRAVKITIWNDEKFHTLSDDAQLVWFHVYTNAQTNGLGLYHATIEGLAANKRWSLERYRKGFGECSERVLFCYDETAQVIYFPNFIKHNKPANPNVLSGLLKVWSYIPETRFKALLRAELEGLGDKYRNVVVKVTPNVTPNVAALVPQTETVTETVTVTETNPFPSRHTVLPTKYLGGAAP